jgi:hypothetical protein
LAELIEAARGLAPTEQYELANQAMAAAEAAAKDQDDIDAAWRSEFRRRINDVESGRVQMVEHAETVRAARVQVAARRAKRTT